jgi:transcriptional regulator with XRE-family HTH domain
MPQLKGFAELLKHYRKTMGWTQEDLGIRWGYSSEAISSWERGVRRPDNQQLPRIAHLLDTTSEELLRSIEETYEKPNSYKKQDTHVDEMSQQWTDAFEMWGELQHVYRNRTEFSREISYPRIFEDAHNIFAAGISLNAIAMNYGQDNIIKSILERKSKITLCFLDPDGVHCAEREREENHPPGRLSILTQMNIANMEIVKHNIRKIDPESAECLKIMVYDLAPRFNIYEVDETYLTVQSYAYGRGEDTPTFVLRRQNSHGLFDYYAEVARHILEQAKPIDVEQK